MSAVAHRLRPPLVDRLLAVGLVAVVEIEVVSEHLHPYGVSIATFGVSMAVVAWRRRAPFAATLVGFGFGLIGAAAGVSQHGPFSAVLGALVGLYSLALYATPRRAVAGLGYALVASYGSVALAVHYYGESFGPTDLGFMAVVFVTPWLVGRAMRGRVTRIGVLADRAETAERESETRAKEATREERARIARELHDVIAHSVSVMVVQAGAAEEVLRRAPERALDPIRAVQDTGRQALAEMARLLGMLRRDSEELGLAPQPGLEDLGALVEQTRLAGLPVVLRVEGSPCAVSLGADLSAYRIAQEALTNVRKHAGDARATVTVHYGREALELVVDDDGAGSQNGGGGGHGLVGMRERVALFGGDLEAGPRPGGGFRVRARLPLEAPP